LPNRFLIVLDDSNQPYISRELGRLDKDSLQLHVFAHEYWHYLHNVSTVAGFKSFSIEQHHVAAFSAARQGLPVNVEDRRSMTVIEYGLYGDAVPPDWPESDPSGSVAVTGVEDGEDAAPYGGKPTVVHHVCVDLSAAFEDGQTHAGTMLFGAIALYEFLAAYVEDHVLALKGQASTDTLPIVPYRLAPLLVDHIAGKVDGYFVAALATLALLDVHPGKAFVMFVRQFAEERDHGVSEEVALASIIKRSQDRRTAVFDTILSQDLPDLERVHSDRGLSEFAVKYYGSMFRGLLELRREEPLFDLHVLLAKPDGLFTLFNNVDPCNMLQRYPGDDEIVERDAIFGFDNTAPDDNGITPSIAAKAFHAQQHYVRAHLLETGLFVDAAPAPGRCPFYEACPLEVRTQTPEVCRSSPWNAFPGAQEGCWYSLGVAATHSVVKIRVRPRSEG